MDFIIGKTYKLQIDKGFKEYSIYTLKVEGQDAGHVWGIDLKKEERGFRKSEIMDWVAVPDERK